MFLLVSFPFISFLCLCHPRSEDISPHSAPGTTEVQQDSELLPAELHRLSLPTSHLPSLGQSCACISAAVVTGWDGRYLCEPPHIGRTLPPMSAAPSPPRLTLAGYMHVYFWCLDVLCRVLLVGYGCPTSCKWKGGTKGTFHTIMTLKIIFLSNS